MSIEQHQWSDEEVVEVFDEDQELMLVLESGVSEMILTRNDTIALAKHFELTEEDFKDE